MFHYVLRSSLNIFSRRFLSQTRILPYEIDRFNGAQVRDVNWPDDVRTVKEILSGICSIYLVDFFFFLKEKSFYNSIT